MTESNVFNMDCMIGLKAAPDKFWDLAIVDPPYGINGDTGVQKNEGKWGFKDHKKTNWDNSIPPEEYFIELFRVSKNQIIWGGNYFTEYLPPRMGWVSWDKAQTNFSFSDFELAWTSFDCKCRKFELTGDARYWPKNWEQYWRQKFDAKSDIEKSAIVGALMAARIDRLQNK